MNLKISLSKKHIYILAVSGGIDSMVLLDLMTKQGYKLIVVHFNHQKRKDANLDYTLIKEYTASNNIPLHYIKLSIKGGNFQSEARLLRHKHLEDIAQKHNTPYIVTAHHLDDLAETILMRIIRGSDLFGYASMQESTTINNHTYLKPLINISKEDIVAYANFHIVKFNEDYTNLETHYFRNRIRHEVMPLLKQENDVLKHFKNFSNQSHLAAQYIRSVSKKFITVDFSFEMNNYTSLDKAIQMDLLAYILESHSIFISYEKLSTINKQLLSKKPNITISLSKEFNLIKEYNKVYIKNTKETSNLEIMPILNVSHKKLPGTINGVELCYNKLDLPILIRKRLPGDMLSFPYGRKKLKSYLIDKKIPMSKRNSLYVITDSNNQILWIPNLYLNETLGNDKSLYLEIKEN